MDRLHHIAFQVTDISQALSWYQDNLDVDVAYADDSWALLTFENVQMALVLPGQHPPHIAVERADAENYGPLTKHRDGTASTYTEDPFGNAVEIMQSDRPV